MSYSSWREIGAETVLLVEGVTEVKTIQQFLRLLKLEHSVLLLPLGGHQMIRGDAAHELSEIKRITPNVHVLIDGERGGENDPLPAQRVAFLQVCKSLGYRAHATERRATENYFTDKAVQAVFGENYQAPGPYQPLENLKCGWNKSDNWRIARHMVIEDLLTTDLGQFLKGIA
jgi:hypothetical protein